MNKSQDNDGTPSFVSTTGRISRIRRLNDALRINHRGGSIIVTAGVADLGSETVAAILVAIATFDAFEAANDPYGEHDFGSVLIEDRKILFKIDYFDRSMRLHSPDAADAKVTARVMTVMLAHEY
jgi:hypothetical protein